MRENKEYYIDKINNSSVFSLDKETEYAAYRTAANRLIENISNYLLMFYKNDYEDYGLEIVETATRCIKNYNNDKGSFLNYFLRALKLEIGRAKGKEDIKAKMGAFSISDRDYRNLRKYKRYLADKNIAPQSVSAENLCVIAETLGVSLKYTEKLKEIDLFAAEDIFDEKDDSTYEEYIPSVEISIQLEYENIESCKSKLNCINELFESKQERTKPLLSKLITRDIIEFVMKSNDILRFAESLSFFDMDIYKTFLAKKRLPSNQDIAAYFSKKESSVSRTKKQFESELKDRLDKS